MTQQTKQFIYRIQPTRPEMLIESTPEEDAITSAHFKYLQSHTQAGKVILAGRTLNTDPSSFGIIIFYADSEADAQEFVNNDPAIRNKVMKAELFPYRVALMTD